MDLALEKDVGTVARFLKRHEVPWGKHVDVKYRMSNTFPRGNREAKVNVLPVVLVRDPYQWMISMVSLCHLSVSYLASVCVCGYLV